MILKFSLVTSIVCYKDTDIEALVPASVSHHCLVLSCVFVPYLPCARMVRNIILCLHTSVIFVLVYFFVLVSF